MITVHLSGVGHRRFSCDYDAELWAIETMQDRDTERPRGPPPKSDHGLNTPAAQAVRDLLGRAGGPVSTKSVMAECQLTRPTASRILHALVKNGEAEDLPAPSGRQAKWWRAV